MIAKEVFKEHGDLLRLPHLSVAVGVSISQKAGGDVVLFAYHSSSFRITRLGCGRGISRIVTYYNHPSRILFVFNEQPRYADVHVQYEIPNEPLCAVGAMAFSVWDAREFGQGVIDIGA